MTTVNLGVVCKLDLIFAFLPENIGVSVRKSDSSCRLSISLHIVQALISVQALDFDLAQLTCQKRFDFRNSILGSSAILLGTSYS